MLDDVLKTRFAQYAPANATEQENMLKETMHHYILASLSKHGLFSEAIFHGGTCLRISKELPPEAAQILGRLDLDVGYWIFGCQRPCRRLWRYSSEEWG